MYVNSYWVIGGIGEIVAWAWKRHDQQVRSLLLSVDVVSLEVVGFFSVDVDADEPDAKPTKHRLLPHTFFLSIYPLNTFL